MKRDGAHISLDIWGHSDPVSGCQCVRILSPKGLLLPGLFEPVVKDLLSYCFLNSGHGLRHWKYESIQVRGATHLAPIPTGATDHLRRRERGR